MNISFSLLLLVLPLISHCEDIVTDKPDEKIISIECYISSDCSIDNACISQKCVYPCTGTCGEDAECDVKNHVPICSCPIGYSGDPFIKCSPIQQITLDLLIASNPCHPSPCGLNALCKEINGFAVCSCLPTYKGSPPNCHHKCVNNDECLISEICSEEFCQDPCKQYCGLNAECKTTNHIPECSCFQGYSGDPFIQCLQQQPGLLDTIPEPSIDQDIKQDSCNPSPCGLYSQCEIINKSASCSCLPTYDGAPPNCHLKCLRGYDCSKTESCINEKCTNPCPNACAADAQCSVINNRPICACLKGQTGDAFIQCQEIQETKPSKPDIQPDDNADISK